MKKIHPYTTNEREFKEFLKKIKDLGGGRLVEWFATRTILELIFDAHRFVEAKPDARVLNIFASRDASGFRENVYHSLFERAYYQAVDFWEDKFIYEGKILPNSHTLPFPDATFDAVITTKIILEHISEPALALKEISRALKLGGKAFLIAPFVTILHQRPYDFFRYSEYGLRHLFKKAGLEVVYIKPTNSGFMTTMDALTLFNIFGFLPWRIRRVLGIFLRKTLLPVAGFFDRFIPDDGGYFSKYYICCVEKIK